MEKAWTPPLRWVFVTATFLGIFSTLQAYRMTVLAYDRPMGIDLGHLLILNLSYWYVPAVCTPLLFRLAHRYQLDSPRWLRSLLVHAGAAILLSFLHVAAMLAVRSLLWPSAGRPPSLPWASFVQRMYLTNLDWALMTYAAIVGLSYALAYHREARDRAVKAAQLETQLSDARLQTLEARLHPHFLFNTLHAISSLLHSRPDAADRMISRLSELLRLSFDRSGPAQVPLREELEFLRRYLDIELTRFPDRLTVVYDVAADALDAEVPRLLLQPLVENAITHGVAPRSGPGTVTVAGRREGSDLLLEVRDDGGSRSEVRVNLRGGVGLSTTRDRLDCLYGAAHRLEFKEGSGGLTVLIRIPYRRAADADGSSTVRVA
jgi:two-component system, LytTR family, sensor kinase